MLIIRDDNVINMCELKFYSGEFDVDNKYYKTLLENTLFCVSYESGVAMGLSNKYESLPCSTRQSLVLQLNGFSGQARK